MFNPRLWRLIYGELSLQAGCILDTSLAVLLQICVTPEYQTLILDRKTGFKFGV